ncbi:MAG: hypothetical protein N2C14_03210, partial [Planctomycetales bacterium]
GRNGSSGSHGGNGMTASSGRWSLFPGPFSAPTEEEQLERWTEQLLARYGVLFRDLMTRESAAPPWGSVVQVLRRWELQGKVRGGRFVDQVAGEQYAVPQAVETLRAIRDEKPTGEWIVISAADPLNLRGIIVPGAKAPSLHTNRLILRDGRFIASLQAGRIEFQEEVPVELAAEMSRALHRGSRSPQTTT